jgi:hypothetical protein
MGVCKPPLFLLKIKFLENFWEFDREWAFKRAQNITVKSKLKQKKLIEAKIKLKQKVPPRK